MFTTIIHCLRDQLKVARIRVFALILWFALFSLWPVLPVRAQELSTAPLPHLWSTNGAVYDLARVGDTIYLAGDFTFVGPGASSGIPLDRNSGLPQSEFAQVTDGDVSAVAPDGKGGWYIGGSFTHVGGEARQNLAHLLADGSVDPNWNPNVWPDTLGIGAIAVYNNLVYVGGSFNQIGGQARNSLAALDAITGAVTSWNPNVQEYLDVAGGIFIIGTISTLLVQGETIYIAGGFTHIGGQPRKNLAAVNATTGTATAWNPQANAYVATVAISGETLYAGGAFTTIGGQARNRLAALNVATGSATAWHPDANDVVSTLAINGATVYAGGFFTAIGGQSRPYLAALATATGAATAWQPNANGVVVTFALGAETLYVGGGFTSIGGQVRNHLAAFNVTTGVATAWAPTVGPGVFTLALQGATLYVGGRFTNLGGQERHGLAALDAVTGQALAWSPEVVGTVHNLVVSGTTVYVGGNFTAIDGQRRHYLAGIDATTGSVNAWNPNADGPVFALAISG